MTEAASEKQNQAAAGTYRIRIPTDGGHRWLACRDGLERARKQGEAASRLGPPVPR